MRVTAMRGTILAFLLIASICFQGVALAKQVLASAKGGDAAHSLLHAGSVPHHHHRGSVHKDTSKESKQHVQDDSCAGVAGMPPTPIRAVSLVLTAGEATGAHPQGHDTPFIEGLKRPPRLDA